MSIWLPSKVQSEIAARAAAEALAAAEAAAKQGSLKEGQTVLRVLVSSKGKNLKKSHEEISSGQLLVTVQRVLQGSPLQYMDDMDQLHPVPEHLLPPNAQPGAYLSLGDRVHEIVAHASQDMYLGRAMAGAEPNCSMVFEVLVEGPININGSGKIIFPQVVEFGNFARNEGIRRSAEEAFSALEEATAFSTNLRSANRAAYVSGLRKPAEEATPETTTIPGGTGEIDPDMVS